MIKEKHKTRAALFGGLGILSVVVASLAARHVRQPPPGRVGVRSSSPAHGPDGASANVDTYSVAGEEDPGAAVDAPAPSPLSSPTT
ncbi:hypothetical protein J2W49_002631 [Hydrogenophaga palleronii]|uniref:Uncharacterized protein n=1 Tax=Hydrogenophaga palleronii TaxID=65655 RepID=A0ABU1WN51_9BURK|nr:hypothetical protein [Hydrogenophaga palleronii]MDR7150668.1 hypothetical protein [Hydrogenophaga palleronii]